MNPQNLLNTIPTVIRNIEKEIKRDYPKGMRLTYPEESGALKCAADNKPWRLADRLFCAVNTDYTTLATDNSSSALRSVTDIYLMLLYYFPGLDFLEFMCFVFSKIKDGTYTWYFCKEIDKMIAGIGLHKDYAWYAGYIYRDELLWINYANNVLYMPFEDAMFKYLELKEAAKKQEVTL